jgi:hypothetical protein
MVLKPDSLINHAGMSKKRKIYKVDLNYFPTNTIYLNINHLEVGKYTLIIIHNNKAIKEVKFEKNGNKKM